MNIESVNRPVNRIASITVTMADVATATSDQEIRFAAYRAAGETPETTFGASITRWENGRVMVKIHRD